eukprot:363125-Chlamydomonas_euryale.AAC.2
MDASSSQVVRAAPWPRLRTSACTRRTLRPPIVRLPPLHLTAQGAGCARRKKAAPVSAIWRGAPSLFPPPLAAAGASPL